MKFRRASVGLALGVIATLTVLGTAGCTVWRIKQSVEMARQSEPFEASPTQAVATLLVVGDSTGVGTGASSPTQSLVGLIAKNNPRLQIVNHAKDGAKFAAIASQLEALGAQRFDAILVLGGGNDVIRFTGQEALAQAVERTLRLARVHADLVVIMPSGNVGNAPFFSPPVSWLMAQRSRDLHTLVREAAAKSGALYVNLYKEKSEDPFVQRADELNAKDGLHPSDAGYRVWYSELNAQADFSNRIMAPTR